MNKFVCALVLGLTSFSTTASDWRATTVPPAMLKLVPTLNEAIDALWPSIPMRSYTASQVEQETCMSPTHSKCGSATAELKTSREYGFGLGQLTVAYSATGVVRFNAWEEIKDKDPSLKNWAWSDRFNPLMQAKAIVLKNHINYNKLTFPISTDLEKMAFLAVTYNSGSVMKDRLLCQARTDCDPSTWFAKNSKKKFAVESFSTKNKSVVKGYGKSFFDISREYPVNVILLRRPKYVNLFGN